MHAHREGHLIFHVAGEYGVTSLDGDTVFVDPQTAYAVNPWQPHSFSPSKVGVGWICLVLFIKHDWFSQRGDGQSSRLCFAQNKLPMSEELNHLVQDIVALMTEAEFETQLLSQRLYRLTQDCYQMTWEGVPLSLKDDALGRGRSHDFRIRKSIQFLHEQSCRGVDFDSVAQSSGLSRPHFYKLFRDQIGVTPNIYVNTLRMEKAIKSLTTTDQSLGDVAHALGFSSQSGFSRFFTSHAGTAPAVYRKIAHVASAQKNPTEC